MHQLALINPRRKRRHKKAKRSHAKRRHVRRHKARRRSVVVIGRRVNPRRKIHHRKRRFHRRRNPRVSMSGVMRALVPAAIGGAGAVAVDIGVGYLGSVASIPDFLKTGYGKVGLQALAAFGMGFIAKKAGVSGEKANAVVLGALTVTAYSLIRNLVKSAAPTVPGLSGDFRDNIGAYMQPSLGYMNPAPMVNGMEGVGAYMQPGGGMNGYPGMSDDGM